MTKLLLDTSVVIDFLRKKEKTETFLYKLSQEDLYISIITHTELYCGKSVWEKKEAQSSLEKIFSGMSILPLETQISQRSGKIKAYNHDRSILDCVIAATALHHKLQLVTLNTKDFEKIRGLKIYV
ncbi:MAG: hypothetical protein A3F61_02045 [Candidatus Blackburnbacteria bacterium RIFCSPHIGHO2_12_FULL_41_13b]|uniref:PIN domain-containing protein n=1 Tax=Candidatus Blackburnbacteria bacterium RIFCSPHIGHO2_12_FULL_41_13b TaxID=1797517 RepID=A0A1G1V4I6_9BACT|nr:MAG: hypothetical protein A3F61_02045 [Candidatus Blackburnbacteria bacterium RIFCSPHIGHO2_12_FULL_41_13b]